MELKKLEWIKPNRYRCRYRYPGKKYRYDYYEIRICGKCGIKWINDAYYPNEFCSIECGRPKKGIKKGQIRGAHTQESKDKIRKSRIGKKHLQKTKDQIAKSVSEYHRKGRVIKELLSDYKNYPEALNWIKRHKEEVAMWDDVRPVHLLDPPEAIRAPDWYTDNLFYGTCIQD